MIRIGHLPFPSYTALAPMAGITDLPFRTLCREMGAGLVVGEMIHSHPSMRASKKTLLRSTFDKKIGLRAVQIVGNDPKLMAEAAQYNQQRGAELIDINMGCPAKKVLKKAAGSALLSNEKLVAEILRSVVNATSVPITLKFRTGPEPSNRNGARIARIAEDCGISALAVHGRTRKCGFKGQVEYETIAEIVGSVKIPVFANGDINSPEKARNVMSTTGACGVMLGRATFGQPWLCGQIDQFLKTGITPPAPSFEKKLRIIERHVSRIHAFYGEYSGVKLARKHMAWYFKNISAPEYYRKYLNTLNEAPQQIDSIRKFAELGANVHCAA